MTADDTPDSALSAPIPAWIPAFLDNLGKSGNIAESCRLAGINRDTPYKRRESDPGFAAAMDAAIEGAIDELELEARRRALGWTETITKGEEVREARRYSDVLMVTLLKAHRPAKYRESVQHDHDGKIEVRVTYVKKPVPGTPEAEA